MVKLPRIIVQNGLNSVVGVVDLAVALEEFETELEDVTTKDAGDEFELTLDAAVSDDDAVSEDVANLLESCSTWYQPPVKPLLVSTS